MEARHWSLAGSAVVDIHGCEAFPTLCVTEGANRDGTTDRGYGDYEVGGGTRKFEAGDLRPGDESIAAHQGRPAHDSVALDGSRILPAVSLAALIAGDHYADPMDYLGMDATRSGDVLDSCSAAAVCVAE